MTQSRQTVAMVPVRGLSTGKTRLAGVLDAEARTSLTIRMLRTVICAAITSGAVNRVAVISPDPAALSLARQIDPQVVAMVQDEATPGLNAAVTAGRRWAIERGARRFLVLFGDLPLLTASEVRTLAARQEAVVLATDRHGRGTNALAIGLNEPGAAAFRFGFGPDSLAHHRAEAARRGLSVVTFNQTGTTHDLDTPADLTIALDAGADVVTDGLVDAGGAASLRVGDRQ